MKRAVFIVAAALVSLLLVENVCVFAAAPGESIVLDPNSGNYLITYCGIGPIGAKNTCVLHQEIFEPATKINPRLKSHFIANQFGPVTYRYAVKNRLGSRQPLTIFILEPISNIASSQPLPQSNAGISSSQLPGLLAVGQAALTTPSGWGGFENISIKGRGLHVAWSYDLRTVPPGLAPGYVQPGFGFSSNDLPGIISAHLVGHPSQSISFADEGPQDDISDQFDALQTKDFVVRYAAVPTIAVPTPFNRAALLTSIESQVSTWVGLGLLDSVVFTQIDGYLQAAIAAASRTDLTSCGIDVAAVRAQIRKIYALLDELPDDWAEPTESPLMAKLAARVLDFDLDYAIRHP